ncbi:uncharacterized protein LOC123229065 isoform X2 [Mangifera indica]|uniref:uncharacterized protein LOC123229065 isoform X2 n=1 Tax=Mangifera indica TaxID=29780 RepID=UPI001CF95EE3|nr:uncharacterized protein LOC123229065 isoform X2 [Mangifera indica]
MANPGVGTKFLSVNLNKSYGQSHHQHRNHNQNLSHSGYHGSNRSRPGGVAGGGGGMVVLSRPRSSHKAAGPKLSIPPPLNLPSLRKEHEKFDSLGSSGGSAGGGFSGGGQRPGSSGVGWTKPGRAVALQEKGGVVSCDHMTDNDVDQGLHGIGDGKGSGGAYLPPSVRSGPVGLPSSTFPHVEKMNVLRGEDFPSLRAAVPSQSGFERKHRDGLNQKQKHAMGEGHCNSDQSDGSRFNSLVDVHPRLQSGSFGNGLSENGGRNSDLGGSHGSEQVRKQDEYFAGPLPLVRLNPRFDWADDERDTGHVFAVRDRDDGFSKSEAYWDRDFDIPRPTVLPHKPAHNVFDRWAQNDNETGKISTSEVTKVDPFGRDARTPSRAGQEGHLWRASPPLQKDGFGVKEIGNDKNSFGAGLYGQKREANKENKSVSSSFRDMPLDDFEKRDLGYGQAGRQPWTNTGHSSYSQRAEKNQWERFGNEQYNRFRGDVFQNNSVSKSSFSSGGKGLPVNDPILNFGRDKHQVLTSEKPYLEDPFMKDFGATGFDVQDPFSGGLVGVVKKKKDVKQTDFHDPVRESFEAELERVQKMQEQERQRAIEEQERALELARREEEERLQVAREHEEQRRRLEEEVREAAWRAEQERLNAMCKAEEQRIAREEEKQRTIMEEERRKQAAKQKLLELEERMAKRQVEATKGGSNSSIVAEDKLSGMSKERVISKVVDLADGEDSERMMERNTTSASSDSSGLNRAFDMSCRPHFARDNSAALMERGKPNNSWRRDAFENGNRPTIFPQDSDNGRYSPRRDATVGGKTFPRKEFFGGPGYMSSRAYYKTGIQESHIDEINQPRSQRWSISGDGDHYVRNAEVESDFQENHTERYSDVGWGHNRYRGNPYPSYPERLYQNPDTDGLSSFGRSRYSMRHPRVLPPPSLTVVQKTFHRCENERPGPSTFQENEIEYNHAARSETTRKSGFDSCNQHNLVQPEIIDVQQGNTANLEQNLDTNTTLRCDSQSSLSVSSPPDSPVHLSHDDLDESEDSPALSADEDKDVSLGQDSNSVVLPIESGKDNMMTHSDSVFFGDDDEWTVENDERLQEQEEYDEDEDGYVEEDEIHEGDDGNINLTREFEDMHLVEKSSPNMVNNLVLGFNEGVEVAMPNDEFVTSPQNEESSFPVPQVSVGTVIEDQGSLDGVCGTLQSGDGPSQASADGSSRIFLEAENAMQDLVIKPSSTQLSAASELVVHVDANSGSVLSNQQPIPSSVDMTPNSSSDQTVTSAISAGPSQVEAPVKLQFGLFSGPSLIPSPIPAIQIGSIQMPLLHAQLGPSLAHMHPSQSPLFQFGQLRYSSPISQGVPPLAPRSVPFVKSNMTTNFSLNQNAAVAEPIQSSPETSYNLIKTDALSLSMDNRLGLAQRHLDLSERNALNENSMSASKSSETTFTAQQGHAEVSHLGDKKTSSGLQVEDQGRHMKNFKSLSKESKNLLQIRAGSSVPGSKEKTLTVSKAQGLISGGRNKKYVVSVRNNSGSKSSFAAPETSRSESGGFQRRPRRQRTEFRVRENTDKRLSSGVVSANQVVLDDKPNMNGRSTGFSTRSGFRRDFVSKKSFKQMTELESFDSGGIYSQEIDSGGKAGKGVGSESLTKSQNIPHHEEGNLKRTIRSEEDVDTPLQSGVVRVFGQPGIEAPSDEDDFIEVRSKRQMLNDRREQREKEIKAKSRVTKMPSKSHSTSKTSLVSASSNKISASMSEAANDVHSNFVATDGRNLANTEVSTGFGATKVSQPLAPIGTPALKTDTQADKRPQTIKSVQESPVPVLSGGEKNLSPGIIFDSKNKVLDNLQTPMGSWDNSRLNHQVMALTRKQLDEAMNPGQFDSCVSSKDHTSSVGEPSMPSSTILTKDKAFSSTASPINSLLAGEKIQFGAVTSPTVLRPSTRTISHGIGPPGPCRSEIQISHNISAANNDCSLFFDKEKCSNETCVNLEDSEAEAAASAIAVAAISSDEIVGNELGTCSASVSKTTNFGGTEIDGIIAGDQQSVSQSKAEESLSVALPADLSVETSPISLWPPLPSPPNSSSQMISHFPGGPPSHFPFYEMNPMLGGPIFALGPHDESATAHSQTQKISTPTSTPLGTWQQCHSGIDSFYGAPTGYAGPFISPTGGIPGVQGPPHMVVYNHFAPVGQFGQVGLSFMGATYIPSAKQPDWKCHPVSSAMGVGEGEMNNVNMVAGQRKPTNLTAPIQHLAPRSPLMPVASTLAMFDVSPFQSSSDISVQAHWSNVTTASHQPISISMPLQQPPDGVLPPQNNPGPPVDQSSNANRFSASRTSTPSNSSRNFHAASDATVNQLPDELGLLDSSSSTGPGTSTQNVVAKSLALITITDAGKTELVQNNSSSESVDQNNATFKPQSLQQKNMSSQQYSSSSGYSYQRGGGISQKNSGSKWSHRRMGFHGRNQSFSAEKGFAPSKMKQIYVAKQTTSGTSARS